MHLVEAEEPNVVEPDGDIFDYYKVSEVMKPCEGDPVEGSAKELSVFRVFRCGKG